MRETIGYIKNHSERQVNDYYATPPKEVKNILKRELLFGTILDNSCGEGHIVEEVQKLYPDNKIVATDLIDRGYGEGNLNFLSHDYPYSEVDTIIMNPPFKDITEFVNKSLIIAKKKVVLFARLQFLESKKRYEEIFKHNQPNRIYVYVDRIACAKNGDFNNAKSSSMAFGWFVWDKVYRYDGFYWLRKSR